MPSIDSTADLTGFKALSFDCYGTLINWKPHILAALAPVLARLPPDHVYVASPQQAYIRFCKLTSDLEASQPTLPKNENLGRGLQMLAAEAGGVALERSLTRGDLDAMANGPGGWPAFEDSVPALLALKRRGYRLVLLSNIDNANVGQTVTGPLRGPSAPGGGAEDEDGAEGEGEGKHASSSSSLGLFDAVYTAEDIGAYKPSHKNFLYLHRRAREELGVDVAKGELLHVAHGLRVDHTAAREMGFPSCWIQRGTDRVHRRDDEDYNDAVGDDEVSFQWEFEGMKEFVAEVKRQFERKG